MSRAAFIARHGLPQRIPSGPFAFECFQWGPLRVTLSREENHGEDGRWMHAGVSCHDRLPKQDEMIAVREEWFDAAETVLQVFPPREWWVSNHPYCLHLWQRLDASVLPRGLYRTVGARKMTEEQTVELARLIQAGDYLGAERYLEQFQESS